MRIFVILFTLACLAGSVMAQDAIEDNSFLIEEAYNQEKGVIQYISSFTVQRNGNFIYSFTNEMPIKTQRHQFSYTINVVNGGTGTRFGDTFINYRYQLKGMKAEDRIAIAPRFSLILPTGSASRGTGGGNFGFQFNLPVSVKHSKKWVTHWNAGTTLIPHSKNAASERANVKAANLGQSTIFLAKPNFNIMFETSWAYAQAVTAPGKVDSQYALLLNPGIRWAWNFKSGLQIVPGVAFPIGVGPSSGERGAFLYLSFEK